jgi:hypothetical protein
VLSRSRQALRIKRRPRLRGALLCPIRARSEASQHASRSLDTLRRSEKRTGPRCETEGRSLLPTERHRRFSRRQALARLPRMEIRDHACSACGRLAWTISQRQSHADAVPALSSWASIALQTAPQSGHVHMGGISRCGGSGVGSQRCAIRSGMLPKRERKEAPGMHKGPFSPPAAREASPVFPGAKSLVPAKTRGPHPTAVAGRPQIRQAVGCFRALRVRPPRLRRRL